MLPFGQSTEPIAMKLPRGRGPRLVRLIVIGLCAYLGFCTVRYVLRLSGISGSYTYSAPPVDSWCGHSTYRLSLRPDGTGSLWFCYPNREEHTTSVTWSHAGDEVHIVVPPTVPSQDTYLTIAGTHRCVWKSGRIEVIGVDFRGRFEEYGRGIRPVTYSLDFF